MPNPKPIPLTLTGTRLSLTCPHCNNIILGDRKLLRDFQRLVRTCPQCGGDITQVHKFEEVTIG